LTQGTLVSGCFLQDAAGAWGWEGQGSDAAGFCLCVKTWSGCQLQYAADRGITSRYDLILAEMPRMICTRQC
jgi:hypothetical protein